MWAGAAYPVARDVSRAPDLRAEWLRHGGTWFVGVDALPNVTDGSVDGVPLIGAWQELEPYEGPWHRAQVSVTYPDYPQQDPDESDAAYRFRVSRFAAHVDGLLPETGRRMLREPHRFILGLPLNTCAACPLMVWPGSHHILGAALSEALTSGPDVTEAYISARKQVLETIAPIPLNAVPGQAILLHRHMLHGIAPWRVGDNCEPDGRMIAYFRPQFEQLRDWSI